MAITPADIEKVALLARLELTDAERDAMARQLGAIIEYVELLGELDEKIEQSKAEPMAHAVEISNVFRPDETRPSLDRKDALANAPRSDGEHYLVPAVLGE